MKEKTLEMRMIKKKLLEEEIEEPNNITSWRNIVNGLSKRDGKATKEEEERWKGKIWRSFLIFRVTGEVPVERREMGVSVWRVGREEKKYKQSIQRRRGRNRGCILRYFQQTSNEKMSSWKVKNLLRSYTYVSF